MTLLYGAPANWVVGTAAAVRARLGEFGVAMPVEESIEMVLAWVDQTAADTRQARETVIVHAGPPDQVAFRLADDLLLSIAEERPGTDPFSHDATIPVPVALVGLTAQALTVLADLALANGAPFAVHAATTTAGSLLARLTQAFSGGPVEMGPVTVGEEDSAVIDGPIVRLPQPGLAYTARMLENAAARLEQGRWGLPPTERAVTIDLLATNFTREAARLRFLTAHYGQPSTPTPGS